MAGSEADTRYMTDEAFPKTTGTDDKELFLIEGAKHIETYWVGAYVDAALGKLTTFYGRTLWGRPLLFRRDTRSRCLQPLLVQKG